MKNKFTALYKRATLLLAALLVLSSPVTLLQAPVAAASPATAKVSFTFDDGLLNTYNNAAPILGKYGLNGTVYVITDCVGMTTIPNTCHADQNEKYMTWTQLTAMNTTYKWEIGSHTASHPYLASFDATDGQPAPLTAAQVRQELVESKTVLANHGFNATSFASPYGDYSAATLRQIAKFYSNHRGFADQDHNMYPYNDLLLNNMQVQGRVSVASVKAKIDDAIANKRWLVLTFHGIKAKASLNPDNYEWSNANLEAVAAYVKAKQDAGLLQNTTPSKGVATGTNIMPSPFTATNTIGNGWTTDKPAGMTVDTNNNGRWPAAGRSLKVIGSSTQSHLFSPKVAVNPAATYTFKNYLAMTGVSTGEIGYYIDEYDIVGNWISGQYKGREMSVFTEQFNFTYQPTSTRVAKMSLQIYATPDTTTRAFLGATEMFSNGPAPESPTNLLTNGTFTNSLSPWVADNTAAIALDNLNNGATGNRLYSVKLSQNAAESHLFSALTTVDSAATYSVQSYLNIVTNTTGGVGYYVDEYDANGNWISGQYKDWRNAAGFQTVAFQYHPTSTNVRKIRVQVINNATNNPFTAYVDDFRLYAL